ncbi:helix-turn-helix domain-containing protein [Streptomyces mexicanus]|uniref:helix-turn-helix domain-containing protein n=1 Tax=Streptomyces mexicanus TaxID=178566 RepID=UPI003B00F9B7
MTDPAPKHATVIPFERSADRTADRAAGRTAHRAAPTAPIVPAAPAAPREPLWRDLVGDVLRRERLGQERTLKDVADAARISVPYLSEIERGRKEASSEVLAAAAQALGLGLGDLLALAHGRLVRLGSTTSPRGGRGASVSRRDGMCLAA